MTPPTQADQDRALASLSGTVDAAIPDTDLERDLLRLKMIAGAIQRGASWAVIGTAYGLDGKAAKRHVHHLARSCQRRVVARDVAAARQAAPAA